MNSAYSSTEATPTRLDEQPADDLPQRTQREHGASTSADKQRGDTASHSRHAHATEGTAVYAREGAASRLPLALGVRHAREGPQEARLRDDRVVRQLNAIS
jgi:hypothetical protein